MTEEKQGSTKPQEQSKSSSSEASGVNLVEEARAAAEEIRKANAELKELLDRQERIKAQEILAGKSFAGTAPVQPVEETPKQYKDRIMRGG